MDTIVEEALKQYGIAAASVLGVILFCGWIIHKVLTHFMAETKRKDEQLIKVTENFTSSLNANTEALQDIRETMIEFRGGVGELTAANETVASTLERTAARAHDEHVEILGHLRAVRPTRAMG